MFVAIQALAYTSRVSTAIGETPDVSSMCFRRTPPSPYQPSKEMVKARRPAGLPQPKPAAKNDPAVSGQP